MTRHIYIFYIFYIFTLFICCSCSQPAPTAQSQPAAPASPQPPKWGIVIHTGAVAGLKHKKNPIRLARLVMEKSPHVMMAGEGAEAFAKEQGGIEFVDQKYFYTDRSSKALQDALAAEKKTAQADDDHHGTVGAVALDQHGNLAAGAGTYANNENCGISSTGGGEFWIRYTVAHDPCARVQYRNTTIQAAADDIIQGVLKPIGGEGGVIGLDAHGNVMMSFNTTGMSRGHVGADGTPTIMFTANDK
jgi:L-asparaginase / beta-aspartyl-peptidase